MMRDWCQYCGQKFGPDDAVTLMAGLRYHPECAEADKDYMDRAAQHFDALAHDPATAVSSTETEGSAE